MLENYDPSLWLTGGRLPPQTMFILQIGAPWVCFYPIHYIVSSSFHYISTCKVTAMGYVEEEKDVEEGEDRELNGCFRVGVYFTCHVFHYTPGPASKQAGREQFRAIVDWWTIRIELLCHCDKRQNIRDRDRGREKEDRKCHLKFSYLLQGSETFSKLFKLVPETR